MFGALLSQDPSQPNPSVAAYSIDGNVKQPPVPQIPTSAGLPKSVLLYVSPVLLDATHVLVITCPGPHTAYFLDNFIVTQSNSDETIQLDPSDSSSSTISDNTTKPTPPGGGNSSSGQRSKVSGGIVAAIILGSLGLLLFIGTVMWFCCRRRFSSSTGTGDGKGTHKLLFVLIN